MSMSNYIFLLFLMSETDAHVSMSAKCVCEKKVCVCVMCVCVMCV